MEKHRANYPPSILFPATHPELSQVSPSKSTTGLYPLYSHSLIVLVPDCEIDITNTARKVWELAHAFNARIQFIGLCSDVQQEPTLRRQLATMSAMVSDGEGSVRSKVEFGKNWLNVVKSDWHEGDEIVCFAEQRAGIMKKPLSQILKSNMNATVYVLSGLSMPKPSRSYWPPMVIAWAGSIGILAGFFWLDAKIIQTSQDWVHTTLLYFSLLVEVGLIWVWNSKR